MEIPGSRIREWRCYYPSEAEKALNAYQFREEIRYMDYQQKQLDMIRQQAEAMLENYNEIRSRWR